MSPKIWANGDLVADVIDDTGRHTMLDGSPLDIDTNQIEATRNKQVIIVTSDQLGGRREIGLTLEGVGRSWDPKRGDGREPTLEVLLRDRPIRVKYSPHLGWEYEGDVYGNSAEPARRILGPEVTRLNPRWMRSPERG